VLDLSEDYKLDSDRDTTKYKSLQVLHKVQYVSLHSLTGVFILLLDVFSNGYLNDRLVTGNKRTYKNTHNVDTI